MHCRVSLGASFWPRPLPGFLSKTLTGDYLGVALRGSRAGSARITAAFAVQKAGPGQPT